MYGSGYSGYGQRRATAPVRESVSQVASTVSFSPETTQGAAYSVAVMLVGCVVVLAILKKMNFRAVVGLGAN